MTDRTLNIVVGTCSVLIWFVFIVWLTLRWTR